MSKPDIYQPSFVQNLFDEMSQSYGMTNLISSFGFAKRWREQCVQHAQIAPGMTVCDMMTGMGECWPLITGRMQSQGDFIALDFSHAMCRRARMKQAQFSHQRITVLEEDALANSIPAESVDCVISTFGLKTLADPQEQQFAHEIARMLKPGGSFSLVEITLPQSPLLRTPYLFYLKQIIPLIGRLLLGNPDNYRMLGIYTQRFESCAPMASYLRDAGLEATLQPFFFGCASGVHGQKPQRTAM